jgi:hypothetical protein
MNISKKNGRKKMNKGTAKFVKKLEGFQGDARLYEVSPKIPYDYDYDKEKFLKSAGHIIVSAVDVMYSGPETYIFPSDKNGKILNWTELNGSFQGSLNHLKAIENMDYILLKTDEKN